MSTYPKVQLQVLPEFGVAKAADSRKLAQAIDPHMKFQYARSYQIRVRPLKTVDAGQIAGCQYQYEVMDTLDA